MFQSFLSLFPVFLLQLYFRLHEHEDRVVTDAKVLGEGLLEKIISSTHVTSITVDHSGKHMSFNHRLVLLKAVINLSKSAWRIVEEPAGLGKQNLGLSQSRVLLCDVFKQLDSLNQVLGRSGRGHFRLGTTVNQILLSQLHKEVSIELDIELEIGRRRLGSLNMQIQRGVEKADGFHLVAAQAPLQLGLKESVL